MLFVVGLVALGIAVVIWAPVSESGLRDAIEPLGPAAPVGFVPLSAVLALTVARHAGRPGVRELDAPRLQALAALAERRGTLAVILQRLLPAVPDAPCSYLFGLAGVKAWQVALGTLVGSAPRAFSYVALGDAAGRRDADLAIVGGGVLLVTGVAGAVAGLVVLRRSGRRAT